MTSELSVSVHNCGYNTAAIEFEPLVKGMGQTVANALRRVLLTRIGGWALIGVCIDGADHELDKLDGVKEDTVDLVLNLKRLVFGSEINAVVFKGILSASAQGEVLAYSVCLPNGARLFNPSQRICYLSPKSKLRVELVIARGAGYLCAEAVRSNWGVWLKGFIALDANFSPIKRVSYNVVESEYSFASCDKVSMLVESNGTVNLCATIRSACMLLCNQFFSLADALK
ncbi:DNA-directed RNA polymerase subunit alpha [Candidatus Hodgkinia cicadicola]|nr:DNA-directed RNA polymerase subunit alpha [Candidatus Hodgkinia cicadicola]